MAQVFTVYHWTGNDRRRETNLPQTTRCWNWTSRMQKLRTVERQLNEEQLVPKPLYTYVVTEWRLRRCCWTQVRLWGLWLTTFAKWVEKWQRTTFYAHRATAGQEGFRQKQASCYVPTEPIHGKSRNIQWFMRWYICTTTTNSKLTGSTCGIMLAARWASLLNSQHIYRVIYLSSTMSIGARSKSEWRLQLVKRS